jgi:hypothetical protein
VKSDSSKSRATERQAVWSDIHVMSSSEAAPLSPGRVWALWPAAGPGEGAARGEGAPRATRAARYAARPGSGGAGSGGDPAPPPPPPTGGGCCRLWGLWRKRKMPYSGTAAR